MDKICRKTTSFVKKNDFNVYNNEQDSELF